jgi:hypothetical protein
MPTAQQKFFLAPVRLRELLTKKAIEATQDKAARKIQGWWTCKMNRKAFMVYLRNIIRCTKMLQKKWRQHYTWYIMPKRRFEAKKKATAFIQVFLKGYLARRSTLKVKAAYQA